MDAEVAPKLQEEAPLLILRRGQRNRRSVSTLESVKLLAQPRGYIRFASVRPPIYGEGLPEGGLCGICSGHG